MSELSPKCDFQYGGCLHVEFCRIRVLRVKLLRLPPSWILNYVNFDGKSFCGTLFSTSVSKSVLMRAIVA